MKKYTGLEIAIIGISCRTPLAENHNSFWDALIHGKESAIISESLKPNSQDRQNKIFKIQNNIKNKEYFDNHYFNYTEKEALLLSPQTRILHESVVEAIDDAGLSKSDMVKPIGLFVGMGEDYNWKLFTTIKKDEFPFEEFNFHYLSNHYYAPSLIAYKLGLIGPSISINTACASSLVTVDLASKSLLFGESNIALAGGIYVSSQLKKEHYAKEGHINSIDGHCRPFDINASGTIWGEGAGIVVLKRLQDAINDNDNIYAIIKGSAVNNDSNRRIGFTAPSVIGQKECISRALKISKVTPESICYIEAHGTGTKLGDPIEIAGLNQAFNIKEKNRIPIGSVKGNIGHLNTAAGIIGLIKTALILHNKEIPPSINYTEPNPEIPFSQGPFFVNNRVLKLIPQSDIPLRASVSSLGIGGTNSHIILEEAPEKELKDLNPSVDLLTLSAKTEQSLSKYINNVHNYILENESISLGDVSYTSRNSKSYHHIRKSFAYSDKNELLSKLKQYQSVVNCKLEQSNNKIVFMYSGQGSQFLKMGQDLYNNYEIFNTTMDYAFDLLFMLSGYDYKQVFMDSNHKLIEEITYYQPLIFCIQYSYSLLLKESGIIPSILIGYSLGEYTAACVSGVFSFEEGVKIIYERAKLMDTLPKGKMLTINTTETQLSELLGDNKHIYISGHNYLNNYVLSGLENDIDNFIAFLKEKKIAFIELESTKAFHSRLLSAIQDDFSKILNQYEMSSPTIPFVSCYSGKIIGSSSNLETNYWIDQMMNPVLYYKAINTVLSFVDNPKLLDIGPSNINYQITKKIKKDTDIYMLSKEGRENELFISTIGKLWEKGVSINWDYIFKKANKVSLPSYAFDKIAFLNEIDAESMTNSLVERRDYYCNMSEWVLEKDGIIKHVELQNDKKNMLVFSSDETMSVAICDILQKDEYYVVTQDNSIVCGENVMIVDDYSQSCLYDLLIRLKEKEFYVSDVLFIWDDKFNNVQDGLEFGYNKFFNFMRAYDNAFSSKALNVSLLANKLFKVFKKDELIPIKSTLISAIKIACKEFLYLSYNIIDLDIINNENIQSQLSNNITMSNSEIAIRNGITYRKRVKEVIWRKNRNDAVLTNQVILITGGYGGIGFEIAKYFAEQYHSNLIIIGKSEEDPSKRKKIESFGINVHYIKNDFEDKSVLEGNIKNAESEIGKIVGVIHTAGVGDFSGLIINRDLDDDEIIFRPKIYGSKYLVEILQNNDLHFFISTASRVISRPFAGQLGYTAANNYLESLMLNSGYVCLQLPAISDVGMAVKAYKNLTKKDKELFEKMSISSENVNKLIREIISNNISSESILITRNPLDEEDLIASMSSSKDNNNRIINRKTEYLAPSSDIEKDIISIYQNVLGISDISLNDNLYELGGDSLKGMSILNKIREKYNIDLPLKKFLESDNINEVTNVVETLAKQRVTIRI